jgi:hypothetical protein
MLAKQKEREKGLDGYLIDQDDFFYHRCSTEGGHLPTDHNMTHTIKQLVKYSGIKTRWNER